MIARLTCLLFVVPSAAAAADEKGKKELAPLQGTWRLVSLEQKGGSRDVPDPQPRLVIKDDKISYGGAPLATLTADPATTPKSIDLAFVQSKQVYEGIWSVEDDTLKLCVNRSADGVKERPQGFSTEDKEGFRLLVFKKEKDGDPRANLAGFVGVAIKFDEDRKAVVIMDTIEGSPARKAGLKAEDVIVKVGADDATDLQGTVNMIRRLKPDTELTLRIRRGEKEEDVKVKVGVLPFLYLDRD